MTVLAVIEKLEKSDEFNSWKKKFEKAYLVHVFKMLDDLNKDIWQIGYFNPETSLITVFVVNGTITRNPDAEIFQEQKRMVNKLIREDIKIDEDQALEAGKKVLEEHYKGTQVFKTIMILQDIQDVGQVWNFTFVTQQFKTVNVRIDSKTGEVKSHKMVSLLQDLEK